MTERRARSRPIPVPEGTPKWGAKWKRASWQELSQVDGHCPLTGSVMSHRGNYLDLDPTYRDGYGRPLLRMTFDFTDNEHTMSDYLDRSGG